MVFRAQVFRKVEYEVGGKKVEFLTPIDVEAHVNALGIGLLGAVLVAGGIAAWLLWDGLAGATPIGQVQLFRGLKESPYWQDQAKNAQRCGELRTLIRQRRATKRSPGCDAQCKEQMDKEIAIFEQEKEQIGCRF